MTEPYVKTLSAVPGEGVLARFGELVLLCSAEPGQVASARQLVELTHSFATAGHDGRRFCDRIAELLDGSGNGTSVPRLVAFGPVRDGAVIVTAGEVAIRVATESGDHTLTSAGRSRAVITVVSDTVQQVRAGLSVEAARAEPGRWSELIAGVVGAAGLHYALTVPDATEAPVATGPIPGLDRLLPVPTSLVEPLPNPGRPPAAPVSEGSLGSSFSGNGSARDAPAPSVADERVTVPVAAVSHSTPQTYVPHVPTGPAEVLGVYCKNEHFNRPDAPFCSVCGVGMVHRTLIRQPGPRPSLGVLVVDDGSTVELDTDYVIGRDPDHDENVMSGRAQGLAVTDPEDIVSRIHAQIILDGWDVTIADLDSANGTHIRRPDQDDWEQIEPRRPVVITPGTRVWFGSRTLRYESNRTPATQSAALPR